MPPGPQDRKASAEWYDRLFLGPGDLFYKQADLLPLLIEGAGAILYASLLFHHLTNLLPFPVERGLGEHSHDLLQTSFVGVNLLLDFRKAFLEG